MLNNKKIPKGWEIFKLGKMSMRYGENLPTSEMKEHGFPVFGANGEIGYNNNFNYENSKVLVSCRGENSGVINISKPYSFITNNSIVLEEEGEFNIYFLAYSLEVFDTKKTVSGSAQPQVTINDLSKFEILKPDLNEQEKIVEVIKPLERKIELTQSLIAKYENIKQGMMQDLLSGRKRINEKGEWYEETSFIKVNEKLIPKSWEKVVLGKEIEVLSGCPFDSELFNENSEGLPLIRIRDILDSSVETFYNGHYEDKYIVKYGDILIGMDGDYHINKWKNKKALLNQRILMIKQKEGSKININYIYYFLKPFLKKIHDITPATTVKHLSVFDITKAEIFIPSLEEQIEFSKILENIDKKIEGEKENVKKFKELKKGLMQDLLTGKVRVKV